MAIIQIPEPRLSVILFSDTRASWLWLPLRIWLGWSWLMAGWTKFQNPAWLGDNAGTAITGFLKGAVAKSVGAYPQVSGWYADFIQNFALDHTILFSNLIVFGEIAVGLGLILGVFTGIAAFFGTFMNLNFLFAGTVSTNPVMLLCQLFLILAWRNAGWIGADKWLVSKLGVPWR